MLQVGDVQGFKTLKDHAKKKTKHYQEQDPQKVKDYLEKIRDIPKDKIAYVDETGIDSYLCREYARAPRGESVYGRFQGRKFQRSSIVAAQVGEDIIAPLRYCGTMRSELFDSWFAEQLIPSLPQDVVIVMDNASFHRKKQLYAIAEEFGRTLIFLPPYSPELNPIEHFWYWLKRKVCEFLRLSLDLGQAISQAFLAWISYITFK